MSRWASYKKATGLDGEDVTLQLVECCCEELRKDHYRNFPTTGTNLSESLLLSQIKQIAVRAKNRAVNRFKLNTLRQDKGEPIRRFAGRIRSLAVVSEYGVECSKCKIQVSYTDEVIMDQVIAGIADLEIQKDVLSHPEAKSFDLEKLLSFIEGKESGLASQGFMSGNRVETASDVKNKDKKCKFCGELHIFGKKNCRAAGKLCDNCGKKGHLAKVCRSKKKVTKDEEAANVCPESTVDLVTRDQNWACGAIQEEVEHEGFQTFDDFNVGFYDSNKESSIYPGHIHSQNTFKNGLQHQDIFTPGIKKKLCKRGYKNDKKVGLPTLVKNINKNKRGFKILDYKKVGPPTLVNNQCLNKQAQDSWKAATNGNDNSFTVSIVELILILLSCSAILSSLPASQGQVSSAQDVQVKGGSIVLGHHVHSKSRGWVRQAARNKPMVELYSRLDMGAYKELGLKPPSKQIKVSSGQHLADTGASICLGGKSYLRSLGLSIEDLTPCDMTVCGANNSSIKVLGALLIEFSRGPGYNEPRTKQIVYICEGVVGALLSLEACMDLKLVNESFPQSCNSAAASSVGKKPNCDCKCPVRQMAPDPPTVLPMKANKQNVMELQKWILDFYSSSAFNCCECQPLPSMHGPPLKIHMQEGVKPVASHSPIPVPIHWKKSLRGALTAMRRLE